MQEETPQQKLGERGLGDILNETFAVYGRRFKKLVALAAVVQIPLTLLTLGLAVFLSNDTVAGAALVVIAAGVGIFSYGALICAVGQHLSSMTCQSAAATRGYCGGRCRWRCSQYWLPSC